MSALLSIALAALSAAQVKTSTMSAEDEATAQQHVSNDCLACHTDQMLEQQRLTLSQWDAVVTKMRKWGAPTEPEAVRILVRYLAAKYRADAPAYQPKPIEAKKGLMAMARLPDGKYKSGVAKDGKALYEKMCVACHAPDGRGADFGVALTQRTVLFRADEFAEVVRNGKGRMPGFQDLSDKNVAALIAYLRILRDQ